MPKKKICFFLKRKNEDETKTLIEKQKQTKGKKNKKITKNWKNTNI